MKKIITLLIIATSILASNFILGQEPVSIGLAPQQKFEPWSVPLKFSYSRAYEYNYTAGSFQLNSQFLNNSTLTPVGSPVNFNSPPGAAAVNTNTGTLYVVDGSAPYTLYSVDTITGVRSIVCINLTDVPLQNLTGITWDPTDGQLWGISTDLSFSQIYRINTINGKCSTVGPPSSICPGAVSISASLGGTLYVIDIINDALYTFNKTTGVPSLIGSLGINANYAQDAQFDLSDGKFYWLSFSTAPELREVDTLTGSSTVIGSYTIPLYTIGIFGRYGSGINNIAKNSEIKIYPNPANNIVNISAPFIETLKVQNLAGQIIDNIVVNSNHTQLNISDYDVGVYFLQVKTNKGSFTKKLSVNK